MKFVPRDIILVLLIILQQPLILIKSNFIPGGQGEGDNPDNDL